MDYWRYWVTRSEFITKETKRLISEVTRRARAEGLLEDENELANVTVWFSRSNLASLVYVEEFFSAKRIDEAGMDAKAFGWRIRRAVNYQGVSLMRMDSFLRLYSVEDLLEWKIGNGTVRAMVFAIRSAQLTVSDPCRRFTK